MPIDLSNSPPLLKGGAFFIDNSTYESVQECDRKAQYRILNKREIIGRDNALNFGGACHAALDMRYRTGGYAHDSLAEQQLAGIRYLNEHITDDWRNSELLVEVLNGYSRTYPVEDFQLVASPDKEGKPVPFVELPFAVPLGEVELSEPMMLPNLRMDQILTGTSSEVYKRVALEAVGEIETIPVRTVPVIWTGKIDLVITHNGEYWLADHKTSSMFGDSYFEAYKISSQFMGYKWALEEMLHVPVAGTLVNVLAIRKPTKTGKNCTYHRQYMRVEDHMVPEWRSNTMHQISEFFANLQHGYFPMRTTACRTKWHRNCEYLGVCTLPPAQREMYLRTGDFQSVTWSPLRED